MGWRRVALCALLQCHLVSLPSAVSFSQTILSGAVSGALCGAETGELRYCQLATIGTAADAAVQLTVVWAGPPSDANASPEKREKRSTPAPPAAAGGGADGGDSGAEEAAAMRRRHPRLARFVDELWLRANGPAAAAAAAPPLLHSVWGNLHAALGNAVVGREWALLLGERWHWERFGGADVAYSPGAFLQANYAAFDALLRRVADAVPVRSRVCELYAGSGAIGARYCAFR